MLSFLCDSALSPLARGNLSVCTWQLAWGVAQGDWQRTQTLRGKGGTEAVWALEQTGRFQVPRLPLSSVVS